MILNDMQKEVVYSNERFLFLLAGAGSGKTRVIIERIKHLIHSGVPVDNILGLTFTHKAAKEMQERINQQEVQLYTFHQYALKSLKNMSNYPYQIYNEEDKLFSKDQHLAITKYKNSYFKTKKPKCYDEYQLKLSTYHKKDFDDILIDFYHLLDQHSSKLNYQYIFVDEFQDTNYLQYMILKKLIGKETHVLCVGDPDQSIYQFRGAQAKIISQYIKDYQAKVMKLTINYRSNATIVEHANRLIKRNYRTLKKDLIPYDVSTQHIKSYMFMYIEDESFAILKWIKTYINQGIKPQEIAILFRQHHRSFYLIQTLKQQGFTYFKEKSFEHDQTHINLLTIHQAKGLEFEVVIILGLEAYTFPSSHTYQKELLEEERRLMFVAMTRAKRHLIFTHVRYNSYMQRQKPSLFIKEAGIKSKIYNEE
jgi:DNA helicase-2/ATP-dependent DNA helicase PcrA